MWFRPVAGIGAGGAAPALALLTLLSAGCAGPQAGTGSAGGSAGPGGLVEDAFAERAREVAAAWEQTSASGAWRTGFVPLQDLTLPPAAGFPTDDAKQAFLSGYYALHTTLPEMPTAQTRQVRFPDGTAMRVGIMPATEAYAAIDRGDPPCPVASTATSPVPGQVPSGPDQPVGTAPAGSCRTLTVTGASLGEVRLRTSRGAAWVPAWLFTISGLAEPVARVAVVPDRIDPVPSPPVAPQTPVPGLVGAHELVVVDGARITYRLGVGACDEDIRPLVHQTDAVVVVGGRVSPPTSGACIELLKLHPVTVTLAAPLGARPVVDAGSGSALPLTVR